jgi:23S rRNA (adenine2503-C2)-methyltransferase
MSREVFPDLSGMSMDPLLEMVAEIGQPRWRAGQLFRWIHGRLAVSFGEMSDLPAALRGELEERCILQVPPVAARAEAEDGSVKYVMTLRDGLSVETVLLPAAGRLTACLSTQVGCPLGCRFCRTGAGGYRRGMTAGEISGTLDTMRRESGRRVTNVVFMGMGEPLLDPGTLEEAIRIIADPAGAGVGTRHVTVSTIGIPEGIDRLSRLPGQVGLAFSLHSAIESTRRALMPGASRWDLREIRRALVRYSAACNRPVTIEYCLLAGINDTRAELSALAAFARGLRSKINLIQWNEVEGAGLRRVPDGEAARIASELSAAGLEVTLRRSLGSGVGGACGQLGASLDGAPL